MKSLWFLLSRRKNHMARAALSGLLVNTGMALITPIFLKTLFDRCVATKDIALFAWVLCGFMALVTAWRVLEFRHALRVQALKNDLRNDLVAAMLRKYYRLPYVEAIQSASGSWTSRLLDEPSQAVDSGIDLAIDSISASIRFLVAVTLLAILSLHAMLLLVACVPILAWLADKYGKDVRAQSGAEKHSEADTRGFMTKAAQSYRAARLFALEETVGFGLDQRLSTLARYGMEKLRYFSLHNAIGSLLTSYAEMAVFLVCGHEMMAERMTFGGFMAFMSGFWTALNALRLLVEKSPELAEMDAILGKIRIFLNSPEPRARPHSQAIRLSDVMLGYQGRVVLPRLDLSLGASERILLRGSNGSGKSTLANLLCGFLPPLRGAAALPSMSRVSAYLTPYSFIPGTVADHLACARLTPAQTAYMKELMDDFGLEALLDGDPDTLSSGQRAKIGVIAALLKDADFYIFDEPLANLDAESKPKVLERIFARTEGKCLILIMHGDEGFHPRFDRVVDLRQADFPPVPRPKMALT